MSQPSLTRLWGWRKRPAQGSALQDCALIVPTYRRPKEILRLLELLSVAPAPPGEVLVIDGSPEDAVDHAIRAWAQFRELPYELVYISSPAGLTLQRNVGLDACNKDFIFFLDDDCLPKPGYFRALREVFLEDKTRKIGAVRGFFTNGINKKLTLMWRLRHALGIVPRGEPGRYHHCCTSGTWDGVPPFKGAQPVDVLAGGASAYRREVFIQHRFSEYFYGYAQGEDMEMSLRIGRDWRLMVCGDALLFHDHAGGGRPAGYHRGQMAMRNRYFIWKRHSPQAGASDRIRFWADHALIIVYNTLVFLLRPWRPYNVCYACGTFFGAIGCIFRPPVYQEPPSRKTYRFRYEAWERVQPAETEAPKAAAAR